MKIHDSCTRLNTLTKLPKENTVTISIINIIECKHITQVKNFVKI